MAEITNEIIAEAIDLYLDNFLNPPRHSHYPNELFYGFCSNGSYELSTIDISELSQYINKHIEKALKNKQS